MTSGERSSLLFDLVITCFEANYNPHLIYDASCLAKEYGYNRELKRFMQLPSQPTGSMNAIIQLAQTLSKAPNTALL